MNEDLQLVFNAQKGCKDSFNQLVVKYSNQLVNFLWRRGISLQEAEDVAQEALIQAYKKLNYYQPKFSFSTWLYTIARNISIDKLRAKRFETVSIHNENRPDITSEYNDDPAHCIIRDEEKYQMWEMAKKLSPHSYELLQLHYAEEKSISEIAFITKRTKIGVKVALHRARKQLFKNVNENNSVSEEYHIPNIIPLENLGKVGE